MPTPRCFPTLRVLRLNGYKFYSTGTLFADVIAVSAVDADGSDVQVIMPTDRAGVELFDDWDGFGQRTTASGGTRFTDVEVHPDRGRHRLRRQPLGHGTTFLQLYLAAVSAGIALRQCSTTLSNTSGRGPARPRIPWPTRLRCRSVRAAGGRRDRGSCGSGEAWCSPPPTHRRLVDDGRQYDPDALADTAVAVAKAQLVAERLTLRAAERLFDTGGASATASKLNLDRHWRNARTVASHSPLAYKAYAAGNYAVNGTRPPANGYFCLLAGNSGLR